MKKLVRRVVTGGIGLVVAAAIGISVFGGAIVRSAVNGAGAAMLGVPVTLKGASVSLLSGRVRLSGLHIGNPQGFKTDSLCDVGTIEVKLKPSSLLSDTIVIEKILVDAPEITFERGIRKSNFGALLEGLSGKGGGTEKPAPEAAPADASKPGKKVVIDELTVSDGKVKLSLTAAMGFSAPVALATISMKDIGRDSGTKGMGVTDIVGLILGTVFKSVVAAVGNVGEFATDGMKAVGGAAVDGASVIGGAAAGGARDVGNAAAGAVRDLGGGVGKALGGLFGGHGKTNAPAAR
ncbi:MAG: AsmA family protein [Verrucomicrobia bacterium]|nr:AsmA family protein [Verrucomicrobiota bacterium]